MFVVCSMNKQNNGIQKFWCQIGQAFVERTRQTESYNQDWTSRAWTSQSKAMFSPIAYPQPPWCCQMETPSRLDPILKIYREQLASNVCLSPFRSHKESKQPSSDWEKVRTNHSRCPTFKRCIKTSSWFWQGPFLPLHKFGRNSAPHQTWHPKPLCTIYTCHHNQDAPAVPAKVLQNELALFLQQRTFFFSQYQEP